MCAEFAGCCGVNGLGKLYRLTRGFIVGRDTVGLTRGFIVGRDTVGLFTDHVGRDTVGLFTDHDSEGFDWEFEVEGRNERVGRK